MKKILVILSLVLFAAVAVAQSPKTAYLSKENTFFDFSFTAADSVNEDETYNIVISAPKDQKSTQDIVVTLDSISGAPNATVTLYGRKFNTLSYASIGDAVTWAGTSSDTTFVISNTTANRYRDFKLAVVASATVQQFKISDAKFKIWIE